MIRKMTSISVEYGIIPDKFDMSYQYSSETGRAELRYYEYSDDPKILRMTKMELKKRIENAKWNFPDIEFYSRIRKNRIGIYIKGSKKYVIWGLLQEVLLQAKCVMTDDEIHYLVDETRFMEGKE